MWIVTASPPWASPRASHESRVWGAKERLFERAIPLLDDQALATLLEAAQICDGLVKGLKHPLWPVDPWAGLQRLVLMLVQQTAVASPRTSVRLALQA